MSQLPEGWQSCPVEEIFKSFSGGTPSRDIAEFWNGNIPWLSSGDIKTDRIETSSELITEAGLHNSSAKLCRSGSVVVVVRSGILKHTLPVAILEKQAAINQDIKCFDSGDDYLNQWLALSLKASAKEILGLNREGTTVQSVKYDTLKEFELCVPPLAEQRRIVAKLETLLGKVDACQQRLAKIPLLLKRFRQAVLAAACSGRLTADWRNSNYLVDELPENWRSVQFGELVQEGPQNGLYKAQSFYGSGTLIVRIDNFYDGKIDAWESLKRLKLDNKEIKQYGLSNRELLINRVNSMKYLGKSAIVENLQEDCVFESNMMRCRLATEHVCPNYAILYFQSARGIGELRKNAKHAVNQSSINQEDVKAALFNLPPFAEQQEIVRRVEAFFKLADQLEAHYQKAKPQVDKLQQSILAKAFRGELVPTEAELARQAGREYESATALLARVREGKAVAAPSKTSRRSKLKRT